MLLCSRWQCARHQIFSVCRLFQKDVIPRRAWLRDNDANSLPWQVFWIHRHKFEVWEFFAYNFKIFKNKKPTKNVRFWQEKILSYHPKQCSILFFNEDLRLRKVLVRRGLFFFQLVVDSHSGAFIFFIL